MSYRTAHVYDESVFMRAFYDLDRAQGANAVKRLDYAPVIGMIERVSVDIAGISPKQCKVDKICSMITRRLGVAYDHDYDIYGASVYRAYDKIHPGQINYTNRDNDTALSLNASKALRPAVEEMVHQMYMTPGLVDGDDKYRQFMYIHESYNTVAGLWDIHLNQAASERPRDLQARAVEIAGFDLNAYQDALLSALASIDETSPTAEAAPAVADEATVVAEV